MCIMKKKKYELISLWIDACLLAMHKTNPKKIQIKNYKQRNTLKLEMNGIWRKKTYLTIGIAIWKSFQLSHIYTNQKKGGSTNLKS